MLLVPACPPVPRLMFFPWALLSTELLLFELAAMVIAVRRVPPGARRTRLGSVVIWSGVAVGVLMLASAGVVVFLDLQSDYWLLPNCPMLTGDTEAVQEQHLQLLFAAGMLAIPCLSTALAALGWLAASRLRRD